MDMTSPRNISKILAQYDAKIRKAWGQNFLTNPAVVEASLAGAELTGIETVVEVGPGLGVMTAPLLDLAREVIAIEIDPLLCQVLTDRFCQRQNFTLVQGDVLAQDFARLVPGPYWVVANLPYYITSPFLEKLITQEHSPLGAVFLVQLEVAQRLSASPGTKEYGSLSVFVQYHCQVDIIYRVSPGSFYPSPKVDSALVKLRWRPPLYRPRNPGLMFKIVRTAFGQRRKMLKGLLARNFGLPPAQVGAVLEQLGHDAGVRGERLSVQDFAKLADLMEVL